MVIHSPKRKKQESNPAPVKSIIKVAEAVATETAAGAEIGANICAVELPSDGTRLPVTPTAITTAEHTNNKIYQPRIRISKKMVVIDPDSGKKYHLTTDDHSLTDKELHVYHKQQSQKQRVRFEPPDGCTELDEQTTATFQTNATGHTMETASALTEVSYAKNRWGILPLSPLLCSNKAVEEARDEVDVVEVGHYKQLVMDIRDPALDDAINDAIINRQSLWLGCLAPNNHTRQMVQGSYRRIQMVIFPHELQQSIEAARETLLGMKLVQDPNDFQAHVSYVKKGSKSWKIGVRKGDVLSFAVALSNVDKDDNVMADKLIKRLESVGMRTSYRELYDIFLSKTTNCRQIGLVFRRWRRSSAPAPIAFDPTRISNEFEWSTKFLQSLTIKCREYEFEQKVPFRKNQSFNPVAVPFVSCPHVSVETNIFLNMIDNIKDYIYQNDPIIGGDDVFLSYQTLRSLVHQSVALAFVCQGNKPQNGSTKAYGTGFVVVRSDDGSWSPPCFLSMMGNETQQTRSSEKVNLIAICRKDHLDKLMSGVVVNFKTPKSELVDLLALDSVIIGSTDGRYHIVQDFSIAIKTSEVLNQGVYVASFGQRVGSKDIVDGKVSPPEQSVDFYGALQSLELPYSMHAHPVIPGNIEPYCNSDWVELDQFNSSRSGGGMLTILKFSSPEDRHEIDIFARRFKYYLLDGVPVQMVSLSSSDNNDERELRLNIVKANSLSDSLLELSQKRKPGIFDIATKGSFCTAFQNITKLSRQPPPSLNLDEEEKKRFFSLETDLSVEPVMMLTKKKRDAELLLSGLKLLLEREKILC